MTKGQHSLVDLTTQAHRLRIDRENYEFLRECGESHEVALERLGWTEKEYKKLELAEKYRAVAEAEKLRKQQARRKT